MPRKSGTARTRFLVAPIATLAIACSTPSSKPEAAREPDAVASPQARSARKTEAALDEAQYRREAEELAAKLGVEVPAWQKTWKARLESLQYLERKQLRKGQDKEEVMADLHEDARDWNERRRGLVEDWEQEHVTWLQIAAAKGREWSATLDPLRDFEAAGLGDSPEAKVLRARQSRLLRESDTARDKYEDAWAVVRALRQAEPPVDLDALVAKVLAEWEAKGPEERQRLREREHERQAGDAR